MSRCKACDKPIEEFPIDEDYEFCNKCFGEILNDLNDNNESMRPYNDKNK